MTYHVNIAIILGVVISVRGEQTNFTLTTARFIEDTTPIPTSQFKRINVERDFETTKAPLDLFELQGPERRSRGRETVWNWDFWCQLQPKSGNCTKGRARSVFYYDAQLDQCLSFIYSGCGGNKNNFETLVDCERHCKGAIFMPLKESERQASCTLQPNSGLCLALLQRYYYEVNTESCKKFVYGGCGGNQNRFHTNIQCVNNCKNT